MHANWSWFVGFVSFLVLYALAPSKPAFAQGADKAGDKLEAKDTLPFQIAGKNFDFGRDVTLFGEIERINIGGTIPSDTASVKATENNSVTILGKNTFLRSMDLELNNVRVFGANTASGKWVIKMCEEDKLNVTIAGKITFDKLPLEETCDVNVVPVLSVDAAAWVDSLPESLKDLKDTLKTLLAGKTIDITLDVKVSITQKLDIKNFEIDFPPTGVDCKGTLKFTSSTSFQRDVSLVKIGIAILKFELKVTGQAKLNLSDTTHEIDAHPRFDNLKGKSTLTIGGMEADFGGEIKGRVTIDIPVVGETELGNATLLELPKLPVKAEVKGPKVVYNR